MIHTFTSNCITHFDSGAHGCSSEILYLRLLLGLCRGSLATSVPAKVAGLEDSARWPAALAHRLWGDCGLLAKRPRRRPQD
jgi:hypothetical protein